MQDASHPSPGRESLQLPKEFAYDHVMRERGCHFFKRQGHAAEHQRQLAAPLPQSYPPSLFRALYRRHPGLRKVLQPRHHQNECNGERRAQQALQQRHRRHWKNMNMKTFYTQDNSDS